jgi:hypothetical protein
MLGAIALMAILSAGALAIVRSALEDTRGQHAGQHQSQVVEAADRYMRDHYADLVTATAGGPVAVPVTTLADLLPAGFEPANAYGQTPCVRIVQPQPGRLNALIVTEGGQSIPARDIAYVAAHAGRGGGQIVADDTSVAQGVFGSWRVDTSAYGAISCSAAGPAEAASNRLASALFFDGPQANALDYLYRREVPGHPELNALDVPLGWRGRAIVVENDSADPLCSAADPASQGRVGVSADGAVLSCQAGTWRRQGSAYWKDPVPTAAALPATGNNTGDVRLTADTSRAFAWNGAAWQALAADENGNFVIPGTASASYLQINSTETVSTPCVRDGLISRNGDGLLLICRSGRWDTAAMQELAYTETGGTVVMRSNQMSYPAGTTFYSGPFAYDAPNDTVMATIERDVQPTKDGLIISNVNADFNVGSVSAPSDGQMSLVVQVVNRDTGAVIAVNRAMSPRISTDETTLAVTLSKAVPRNRTGYAFQMTVLWTTFRNNYASNFYTQANYLNAAGQVMEVTPLQLNWSIDLTY